MNTKERNIDRLFDTIVNSILSTQPIQPAVIRQHIQKYADAIGETYETAREHVVLEVSNTIYAKLNQI